MALNFLDKQFDKLKGVTPQTAGEPRQGIAAGKSPRLGFLPPPDDADESPEPWGLPDKLEPRTPYVDKDMAYVMGKFDEKREAKRLAAILHSEQGMSIKDYYDLSEDQKDALLQEGETIDIRGVIKQKGMPGKTATLFDTEGEKRVFAKGEPLSPYQKLNKRTVGVAETPVTVGPVTLAAGEWAGLFGISIVTGGAIIAGLPVAYNMLMNAALQRNANKLSMQTGTPVDRTLVKAFADYYARTAKPSWANTAKAIKELFKPSASGKFVPTQKATAQADEYAQSLVKRFMPEFTKTRTDKVIADMVAGKFQPDAVAPSVQAVQGVKAELTPEVTPPKTKLTPEQVESATNSAFKKMMATKGRGGRTSLTNQEVEALRLFIKEHGDLDHRFAGEAYVGYFGDTEIILGVFTQPEYTVGTPSNRIGGEYLVYDIDKNTFGTHSTNPAMDIRRSSSGKTRAGLLTKGEWESGVRDWIEGKVPFPSQEVPLLPAPTTPEVTPPPKGVEFSGKAYRADTGFVQDEGATAADVVRYEQETLGNKMGVTPEVISSLEGRPAEDIVWVTKTKKDAARYGEAREVTIPPGSTVIAEDGDGGFLVLKPLVTHAPSPVSEAIERLASRAEFRQVIRGEMGVPVPIDYEEINWHDSGFHIRNKQPYLTIGTEDYPEGVDPVNFEKLITLHEYWHYMMRPQKPSVEAEAVTWDKVVESAKRFGVNTEGIQDIIKGLHPEYGEGAINNLMKSIAPEIVGPQTQTFKGYNEAQVAMQDQSKNFIVQPKPVADVSKRNLFVQISSQVNAADDVGKEYYDLLYAGVLDRPADFWEVPTWIAEASYAMPNSDVMVVRSIEEAEKTLAASKYARIFLSVMDVNKEDSIRLAKAFPGQVIAGGYVDKNTFKGMSNVTFVDSLEQATALAGGKYKQGVSYAHFAGVPTVPRLCMSKGCLHKCAFCAVSKEKIGPTSKTTIDQQVRAIAKLDPKLVYLDDKTFGQAENYKYLKDINESLSHSPNFEGFIVQTTAPQVVGLDDAFLIDSNIKYVEIGVESYNDTILRGVHKPARVKSIDKATDKLRKLGINFVPNIMVGLPNETAETYANTMAFLQKNADIISHVNVYNFAVYESADISKELGIKIASDANENMVEKSFRPDTELDRKFGEEVVEFAKTQLRKEVGLAKAKKLDELVLVHSKEGGLTYNVAEGHEPRKFGFAVSMSKEYEVPVKGRYITRRDLEKFIANNNVMLSDPAYNLGTWYNEATDTTLIDVSRIVADKSRALALGAANKQEAIYDIVNDEVVPIEPSALAGGAVPPFEPPIPPETLIEAVPPFKEPGKDIEFAPLQDAQTVVDYSTKPDVSRWIASLPGLKQIMSKLNPSAIAGTPWEKAIIAREVMRQEGTAKTLGLTSYRDAVGGEKKLFGRDQDGFMTKGELKGVTLGDIIQSPSKIKGKLSPKQEEWIARSNELTRAYRKFAADNGIKINELLFEEGGEYAGRKVYAKFASDGELLESAQVGAGPSRMGGKLTPQKGRVFATEEEAIRNGYRYLAYSEAQSLNIRALYNRVADQNMSVYLLTHVPWRTTGAPEELVLAAEASRTRLHHSQQLLAAINRAVRGERVPAVTLNSIALSYPEEALELKLAITEIQANRPTADSIQALERSAKLSIKADKADNYAAINARARAREQAMAPGFSEVALRHPIFAGKVFTGPEVKKLETAMREAFEPNVNKMLTDVNRVNAVVRFWKLAGDISPLGIQLIFLAGSNPVIYVGAAAAIPKMLFDPTWISKLLTENKDLIDRHPGMLLSSSGNEFTEAMAKGGMLSTDLQVWPKQEGVAKKVAKLPFRIIGKTGATVLQPWQRVFEGLVDYAGLKMAESLEHLAKTPSDMAEVDQYINEFRGLTSSAKLGVGPNWRAAETATILAPRYNRAIAALLYDAFKGAASGGQSGIRSRLAIQGLTKGILAISAMTVALSMALGEDEEDIKEHFDPNSSRFFTWSIGGTNIGPGTKIRSIVKLIAQSIDNPAALMQLSMDNPALRFLRGNMAPVPGGALSLLTGKDYIGDPVRSDAATFAREMIAKNFLPIWVENVLYEGGSISQRLLRGAGEFFGGRTYPETESDQVTRLRERYSAKDYGKKYEDLNNEERNTLRRNHDDLSEIEAAARKQYAEKGSDVERFYFNEKERITEARNSKLNEAAQAYLDGSITKYEYDKQRAYIRPYYSGGREVLWSVKETFDEYSVKQMEKWIDENIKPEDKALGEYQEYRGSLIEGAELPVDWDLVERELLARLSQYPVKIQEYITANLNSWINDLPPAAKQVEEERKEGIADESWWKDYRGIPAPSFKPTIPTTQPRRSIDDVFSGLRDTGSPADNTKKRIDDVFSALK